MNPKNKLAEMPVRPLLYTMAVPLMLSLLIQSLYNIVDSIFVARLSETALTAASLVYAIQFLMIAIGVGTAVGLNALLSRKLGQKKPEEACRAATTGLFLMLGTSLVFTLVGLLFPAQLLGLFSASQAMLTIGIPAMRIICLHFLLAGTSIVLSSVFQALGNGLFSLIVSVCRQLFVLLPAAWLLAQTGSVNNVWWAFLIAEIVSVLMSLAFYAHINKTIIVPLCGPVES